MATVTERIGGAHVTVRVTLAVAERVAEIEPRIWIAHALVCQGHLPLTTALLRAALAAADHPEAGPFLERSIDEGHWQAWNRLAVRALGEFLAQGIEAAEVSAKKDEAA